MHQSFSVGLMKFHSLDSQKCLWDIYMAHFLLLILNNQQYTTANKNTRKQLWRFSAVWLLLHSLVLLILWWSDVCFQKIKTPNFVNILRMTKMRVRLLKARSVNDCFRKRSVRWLMRNVLENNLGPRVTSFNSLNFKLEWRSLILLSFQVKFISDCDVISSFLIIQNDEN